MHLVASLDIESCSAKALDAAELLHTELQEVIQPVVEHAAKDEIVRPLLAVGVHHEQTCMSEGRVRSLANAENSCSPHSAFRSKMF